MHPRRLLLLAPALLAAGCASVPRPAPEATARRDPPLPDARRSADIVLAALNFVDTPYRLGGQSAETGFDCSGFTRHVYRASVGLTLPRTADEQARWSEFAEVSRAALAPGDLVFFNTQQRVFSHVGIFVGDGRFVHAPRTGAQVRLERIGDVYWSRRFDGARRAQALTV